MKLAVITTVYRPQSHTDVIMARWFEHVPSDPAWGWDGPRSQIVSAYVAQFPDNDLARERFGEYGVPMYDTIAEALRGGGDTLAVDGVLLIAEHGDYPFNRFGQQLYPRAEMFHAIADVFAADGRCVPLFFDKHLSWDFDLGRLMLERARRAGFEVLSASSIPFCRFDPPVSCDGDAVEGAVAIYPLVNGGNPESYGYHSLEFAQQVLERRAGGAAGVVEVTGWRGADVWSAAARGEFSTALFEAVWRHAEGDKPLPDASWERRSEHPTQAFCIRYADGLRVTHVGVEGCHEFAMAMSHSAKIHVTVSRTGAGEAERHSNFAALARVAEDWMWDGIEPFPATRALLTCGTLQAMVHAVALPSGVAMPTPHLEDLGYTPAAYPVGVDHWDVPDAALVSEKE